MPIRPENKARYPKDWPEISRRIRFERAGGKCEWCKAPHGEVIARSSDGQTYMLMEGHVYDAETGAHLGLCKGSEYDARKFVKVVLTVAHLDHIPEHCNDDNLVAICQRCHNRYDAPMRRHGIKKRRRERQAIGELM